MRTARVLPCFADKICRYHDSGQTGRRARGRREGVARYVRSLTLFYCVESARDRGRGDGCVGEQGGGGAQKPCSLAEGAECTWRLTVSLSNMAQISDLEVFAFRV